MRKAHVPERLRARVRERAAGRCEYCLLPEEAAFLAHQVDHVIAEKHGGSQGLDNLALSCALCNRHKGSDLASIDPETEAIVILFHPRQDAWADHFRFAGGEITGLTARGRATARLPQFNDPDRISEREILVAAGALAVPD